MSSASHAGLGFGLLLVAMALARPARAEEPQGCDAFKWSLKHEAELLLAPGRPVIASGAQRQIDGSAVELKLASLAAAALPMAPERKSKMDPSMAGFVRFAAPAAGAYQVTISTAAWIDVVQDGHYIKPSAFSGATGCPGVRKSIRVTLGAAPTTIQISGTQAASIAIDVGPIE